MSTISDTIQSLTSATATSSSSSSTESSDEIMGKEDFLTLLVAQLQNQDPLDPDDPTEFTAQLAQFSSLEQLFNLNESVDALVSSQQTSDQLNAMELIGKEVGYEGDEIEFNGESVEIGYELETTAAGVTITIQDEYGSTVATLTSSMLDPGTHFLEWDGLSSDGDVLASGSYTVDIQVSTGNEETSAATPLLRSEVTGVELDPSTGTTSIVTDIGTISLSSIIAVYDATSTDVETTETTAETLEENEQETESEATQDSTSSTVSEVTDLDNEQIEQDSLTYYLST